MFLNLTGEDGADILDIFNQIEAEFKEFEPQLKYGWFHLKLYLIFQNLSRI